MVTPSGRKDIAAIAVKKHKISVKKACLSFKISETCYRYKALLKREDTPIRKWLIKLTKESTRWGFGLCFLHLRNVQKREWNHKKVYRVYRELGLHLRIKPRKRLITCTYGTETQHGLWILWQTVSQESNL